jgi:hypothetical protein
LIGYSDITALHRVWHLAGVASLHGALAGQHVDDMADMLRGGTPASVSRDRQQFGADLTTGGQASGPLFGGNLEMLARSVGVLDLDLRGHVLLLEINRAAGLGNVDRALTQLMMSGSLDDITAVALGRLSGFEDYEDRGWTLDRSAQFTSWAAAAYAASHRASTSSHVVGGGTVRLCAAIRSRRSRDDTRSTSAATMSASVCARTPSTPSTTNSPTPVHAFATTGSPAVRASSAAMPNDSKFDGATNTSARRYSSRIADRSQRPGSSTHPPIACRSR